LALGQSLVDFNFDQYGSESGLSQITTTAIVQDKVGFLWVGTEDGLNRFDGNTFKVFDNFKNEKDTVFFDHITDLIAAPNGSIWLACWGAGIINYHPNSGDFVQYNKNKTGSQKIQSQVHYDILLTPNGKLWSSSDKGLEMIDTKTNSTFFHNYDVPGHYMQTLTTVSDSLLAVSIDGIGVMLYNYHTNQLIGIINATDFGLTASKRFNISCMYYEANLLYIFSTEGMHQCSIKSNQDFCDITKIETKWTRNLPTNVEVNQIIKDSKDKYWVATKGLGIFLLDNINSDTYQQIKAKPTKSNTLKSNYVQSFIEDNQQNIWICTTDGINKYSDSKQYVNVVRYDNANEQLGVVYGVHTKNDSIVYACCEDYFYKCNLKSKTFEKIPSSLENAFYYTAFYDQLGNLLISGEEHLMYLYQNGSKEEVRDAVEIYPALKFFSKNNLSISNMIYLENNEYLIVLKAIGGFYRFNYKTNQLSKMSTINSKGESVNLGGLNGVFVDSNKQIWLATDNGFGNYNPKNGTIDMLHPGAGNPNAINCDIVLSVYVNDNDIWVATYGGGLYRYDITNKTYYNFNVLNGFPNNACYMIEEDVNKKIWVTTNRGLVKIDPSNNTFSVFTINNGLQSNEFTQFGSFKSPSSILYFSTIKGFVSIDPNKMKIESKVPEVVISDVDIYKNNTSASIQINENNIIELEPEITAISLNFIALNFLSDFTYKYAYKIENYNENWITTTTNQLTVPLKKPNTYKLYIRAGDYSNQWSKNATELTIIKKPYFVETLLFKLICILGILCVLYFISHLWYSNIISKKEKIAAQKSEQFKTQFLANVSHEIRTPMNAIMGFSTLLIQKFKPENEEHELSYSIKKSSESLLVIINDLLDLSKIESGNFTFSQAPFSLRDLHNTVIKMLRFKAKDKEINIEYEIEPELHDAYLGDPVRLKQILINLLDNAIKFSNNNNKVGLKCRLMSINERRNILEWRVIDSGIGMNKSNIENLFKRFQQADSNTHLKYGGTGLGLAICKSLVELQGGKIHCDSIEGAGSTFSFHLPLLPIDSILTETIQILPNDWIMQLEGVHILIADDNPLNCKVASKLLQSKIKNLKIDIATNGGEAVEIIEANSQYDFVLMDMQMPILNGLQATQKIRQLNNAKKNTIIIALTANAQPQERNACLEAGMNEYVSKPFDIEFLIQKMYHCLQQSLVS
jgi:CheY-like chemotaxis protein/ligand-binding sensor domain-containing protein